MKSSRTQNLALLCTVVFGFGCSAAYSQITVACAANMQFAMQQIDSAFVKHGGNAKVVYGASGNLATQIKNGAPFDVFVSADRTYPDSIHSWKLSADAPQVYAFGKLVLWSLKPGLAEKGMAGLKDPMVKAIALADPAHAPYGRESIRALKKSGIYDSVSKRLVFGENISQAAQYVVTGAADIGFFAKAIVLSDQMKGKGAWRDVDSALYYKIAQGVVICKHGADANADVSRRFVTFLLGSESRAILTKFGYSLP
jgi:molybdate transport system substrate-binding protein